MDKIEEALKIKATANSNQYNEVDNPQGVVDMGGATNHLCQDILQEKVNVFPRKAFCLSNLDAGAFSCFQVTSHLEYKSSMQHYFPWHGAERVRVAAARFLTRQFR